MCTFLTAGDARAIRTPYTGNVVKIGTAAHAPCRVTYHVHQLIWVEMTLTNQVPSVSITQSPALRSAIQTCDDAHQEHSAARQRVFFLRGHG